MDQEIQTPEAEEVNVVEAPVEKTTEDLAKEKGWRPKEEYHGDPAHWRSAEVFLALDEPIKKIETLAKELKEQKKANQFLLEHHQKVKESEFKRAYDFLKAEKKAAYEQGDVDRVIEIDEQIAQFRETQKQQREAEVIPSANEPHPDFTAWVSKNDWYEKDDEMRETADALGLRHAQDNPSKRPNEVLTWVESKIKRMYADKFSNPNRNKPSAVEGVSSGSGKKTSGNDDSFDISDEERQVMNTFIRQGIMTKEQYLKELRQVKGAR